MGMLRDRSKEIAEMLQHQAVNICGVQETRFREKYDWMISRKAPWLRNEKSLGGIGIFLTEKGIEEVIEISCVNNRIIVIKK